MLGSTRPRASATAPPTPRWPPGSTAASTTTCSPGWATGWPPGWPSGSASRAPTRSSGAASRCADPGRVHRPRQPPGACSPAAKILEWGDRIATWFLRERDLRGFVPGKGWAHAIAHGADALGALGESPHLAGPELDGAPRRPRPTALLAARRRAARARASPTGWRCATMRCCAATSCRSTVLEPWVARHRRRRRPRRHGRRAATRSSADGQRRRRSCGPSTCSSRSRPRPPDGAPRPAARRGRGAPHRPTRRTCTPRHRLACCA